MKPPRRDEHDTAAPDAPLGSLLSAYRAGDLVALLRGDGLTHGTVRELLKPESAARLQAVLTCSAFAGPEDRDPDSESEADRSGTDDGNVLEFKLKKTCRSTVLAFRPKETLEP